MWWLERASGIEPLTSAWKAKGHPVKPAQVVADGIRNPLNPACKAPANEQADCPTAPTRTRNGASISIAATVQDLPRPSSAQTCARLLAEKAGKNKRIAL